MDNTARVAGSNASSGIAGIGTGKLGGASPFRAYIPTEVRTHHDYNNTRHWSSSDGSQLAATSQPYGGITGASSTTSFDATSLPSSTSLYSSHSIQHFGASTVEAAATSSNGAASAFNSNQRAISEAELLACVHEKRSQASTNSADAQPNKSAASARDRTTQFKDGSNSAHSLDTIDLCHKRIDHVPDSLVDAIKHEVVRLALGYNHITKLPESFAELTSLRYLNIRANNFAHFPECVTRMPNLEILDLSRNKIRNLPREPGRLLALRVLSMNANRLTELPAWMGKMKHLRILKLDNNPLEWPPPHISKMPNVAPPKPPSSLTSSSSAEREKAKRFEDRQMLVWIAKLRSWINDPANQPPEQEETILEQPIGKTNQAAATKELVASEPHLVSTSQTDGIELSSAPSDGLISLQVEVPESPSDRTLVLGSNNTTVALQATIASAPSTAAEATPADTPAAAAAAAAGLLPPLVPQPSTTPESREYVNKAASSAPSPYQPAATMQSSQQNHSRGVAAVAQSPQATREDEVARPNGVVGRHSNPDDGDARQHARNNSHSVVHDITSTQQMEGRRSLTSKKSLPDLRKTHEDILQERRDALPDRLSEESRAGMSVRNPDEQSRDRSRMTQDAASADAAASQSLNAAMQPSARKPLLQARRAPRPNLGNNLGSSSRQAYEGMPNASTHSTYGGAHNAAQPSAGVSQGGGLRKLSLPTVGATQAAADAAAAALSARAGYSNTPPRFDLSHGRMASDRAGDSNWPSRSASPTVSGPRNAADHERNSYFRRLSTLPPSTISKAVPVPVLKFVDGTRGVLFALSQIHAAIGQFMTPVIDERISSQFHRLLDISNGSVANLINALDRFDSLSRRGTPDPSVIRGVLITCKDSVITLRKLISVLQLQLRALQSGSDVRYARTLLLMLYGSMGEVSNSWNEMAPLVEAVQPYLTQVDQNVTGLAESSAAAGSEKPVPISTRANMLVQKSTSNASSGSTPTLPSIAEASAPVRAGSRPYLARGPSRRRHAGSFSAQDLAQGAAMTPSASNKPPFNLEDLQASSAYNTPARGARSRRQGSWGNSASSATTFAQSDSSERSVAADGIQSTAPSTPGGSADTAPQRNVYPTPGVLSTPTSSKQKASASNASSAFEAAPAAASTGAMTPRSLAGTPATPAAGTGKRHAVSHSTGAASGGTAATAAGNRLHMAVSDPKITVDDHLLDMVDNITGLSARVWSILFEHLRSAGIDDGASALAEVSPMDDKEASPTAVGESADSQATQAEGSKEAADGKEGASSHVTEDEASIAKLRELRDFAQMTDNLTSQLRSTYLRAREEEQRRASLDADACPTPTAAADASVDGPAVSVAAASPDNISQATVTKLFDESHQFVRAIVNTSTLIKAISVSHEFPKDLRRMLGQVAQACSNLTVYLLWLSPT